MLCKNTICYKFSLYSVAPIVTCRNKVGKKRNKDTNTIIYILYVHKCSLN